MEKLNLRKKTIFVQLYNWLLLFFFKDENMSLDFEKKNFFSIAEFLATILIEKTLSAVFCFCTIEKSKVWK